MTVTVLRADARNLPLADASVHAAVCDPPYALTFMGREWDSFGTPAAFARWCQTWAAEAYRVLKPGGYLLAFGGTRTWHRLCCGIEDAGFEIRDTITWLYAQGFPKSLDVSKAIDKAAGAEREVVGPGQWASVRGVARAASQGASNGGTPGGYNMKAAPDTTAPATDDARRWQGWGTALKPASEPIVVARKPLAGTVAQNVLAHGTGALNIDGCRVAHASAADLAESLSKNPGRDDAVTSGVYGADRPQQVVNVSGRWPSNVVLSHVRAWDGTDACAEECMPGCPVAELDRQSGVRKAGERPASAGYGPGRTDGWGMRRAPGEREVLDSGGASRFFPTFRYQAKAPSRERPRVNGKAHETVKPLSLMRWLVRLVAPPSGVVLDPFAGSGTTAEAALLEGFDCITCDLEPSHLPLIAARTRRSTGVAVDVPLFDLEGA